MTILAITCLSPAATNDVSPVCDNMLTNRADINNVAWYDAIMILTADNSIFHLAVT